MKEIRMDYNEYKEALSTIEKQAEIIKEFENRKGTIVIERRRGYSLYEFEGIEYNIPKIIGGDEAKAFLRDEFDNLYNDFVAMEKEVRLMHHHKTKKQPVKKWWEWFL